MMITCLLFFLVLFVQASNYQQSSSSIYRFTSRGVLMQFVHMTALSDCQYINVQMTRKAWPKALREQRLTKNKDYVLFAGITAADLMMLVMALFFVKITFTLAILLAVRDARFLAREYYEDVRAGLDIYIRAADYREEHEGQRKSKTISKSKSKSSAKTAKSHDSMFSKSAQKYNNRPINERFYTGVGRSQSQTMSSAQIERSEDFYSARDFSKSSSADRQKSTEDDTAQSKTASTAKY